MTAGTKVSFVVAGAQKSGTTALDAYLREHPELCLPRDKELHFFDRDRFFAVEPVDYAVYHRAFDPRPPQRLLGEVTPAYMYWPTAPERIAHYNPAMKLILVLRNPITRAFSHWNMARQLKRESLAFLDAVKAEPDRLQKLPLERAKRYNYIERGFYVQQLRRLGQYFPPAQLSIFKSEDLQDRPGDVLARIATYLGIAPFPPVAEKTVQAREYQGAMSDEDKRYLIGVFESEIHELERLLGWDCSAWLD
ncbi:MAG: sulfotransferase domain-containing protein [Betaproteobacteria bacterium]|nr:MAG: sulfotransferase domain-containing protein [Betaproteobacteria bacterium]